MFAFLGIGFQRPDADQTAYAVIIVHDIIALAYVNKIIERCIGRERQGRLFKGKNDNDLMLFHGITGDRVKTNDLGDHIIIGVQAHGKLEMVGINIDNTAAENDLETKINEILRQIKSKS